MYANVLCDLPDIDIDEDGDKTERAKAYLQTVIREVREVSGRAPSATWQFSFDVVNLRHERGAMLVVSSGVGETRVWGLTGTSSQATPTAKKDGRFTRAEPPRPDPGQFVARCAVGFSQLTGEDLMTAVAEVMVQRVLSA